EVEPLAAFVRPGTPDHLGTVVENRAEELLPCTGQPIGQLLGLATSEKLTLLPFRNIRAAALDEMLGQAVAQPQAIVARRGRQVREIPIEQAEQPKERLLVAAVRGRGEQDHVAARRVGQRTQQLVPLVTALARRRTGVGLVDDNEVRTGLQEEVPARFAFDVVEADDGVMEGGEDALSGRDAVL